jgi:hypothetical protein
MNCSNYIRNSRDIPPALAGTAFSPYGRAKLDGATALKERES